MSSFVKVPVYHISIHSTLSYVLLDKQLLVLACEGLEIKAYLRKQANSKAVKRHMHNGGMNSFDFHLSPRMIPHICKPEVQFVKFSIEKFVPRGKKVKDDSVDDRTFKAQLSDAEAELIAKYFCSSGKCTWKPSIIAFPHFQAFPSRVHNVMHSFRTRMLIGAMQHVQAESFFINSKPLPVEIQVPPKTSSSQCLGAETRTHDVRSEKDSIIFPNSQRKSSDLEAFDTVISTEKHYISDSPRHDGPTHCFLFGAAYVSVKSCGTVSIASVPSLPFVNDAPHSKSTSEYNTDLLNIVKHSFSRTSFGSDRITRSEANLTSPAKPNVIYNCHMPTSVLCNSEAHEEPVLHEVEDDASTPTPKRSCTNFEVSVVETPASTRRNIQIGLADVSTSNLKDMEMSPRLTNMVEEGVVPESPLGEIAGHSSNEHTVCRNSCFEHVNCGSIPNCSREVHGNESPKDSKLQSADLPNCGLRRKSLFSVHTPVAFCSTLPLKDLNLEKTETIEQCSTAGAIGHVSDSPINVGKHTPLLQMRTCLNARGNTSGSPIHVESRTPLSNLTNSCSSDWHLSSGEASKNTQKSPKFKRLRKYGESTKRISSNIMEDNSSSLISNLIRSTTRHNPVKHIKATRKMVSKIEAFIDEEAEVSSDAEVSDDEEEDKDNSSIDDSFIDDRINPTMETTQAEAIRDDMMAIYRRSLLSQSPTESPPCCSTGLNPGSMQFGAETVEIGSCSSGKISHPFQIPQTGLRSANQSSMKSSNLCQIDLEGNSRVYMSSETSAAPREERKTENRKRKLSFHQVGYDFGTSLQPQSLFQSEDIGETNLQCQPKNNEHSGDVFNDDQFYEGLDLDALEAQATRLLLQKSEISMDSKQWLTPAPLTEKNPVFPNSPSFDLGI
ncbi:Dead-box atp-dependent rna helicase fancm [Thalictrum thalictroides]|uniref:Dead-box atp-dependent rna helicase fancm n=1 Tax=Thalictrum thalictroides TaxID=46969 RepID=A0A7J6VIL1_THATH|nr:Dead-box atp-dependent rna helicase fancm [Thalictrum thalictroides]